mgnify:CR=1 FL=1
MRTLSLAVDADGIALITLDDPSRTINVTSPELVADLMAALDRVGTDPAIRGAVLTSGKPGASSPAATSGTSSVRTTAA